jgi:cAMP-dependent protein kinase regulator
MEIHKLDLLKDLKNLGLSELLINFICEAFRSKPSNLIDFGFEFFKSLKESKSNHSLDLAKNDANKLLLSPITNLEEEQVNLTPVDKENILIPSDNIYYNESNNVSNKNQENKAKQRRKSISAESYDPEKDLSFKKINHEKTQDEKNKLTLLLKKINFFKSLDNNQLTDLINAMELRNVSKDEVIIREGDDGDFFYIIEEGIFCVYKNQANNNSNSINLVETYVNSGHFGELALLYNQPRLATVIAQTSGSLWCIDRISFKKTVSNSIFQKYAHFDCLLKNYEPFRNLKLYDRTRLVESLIEKRYAKNQLVFKKNDIANCMFFVVSGAVELVFDEMHKLTFIPKLQQSKKNSLKLEKPILKSSSKSIGNDFKKLNKLSSYYPSSVKNIKHTKTTKIKLLKEGDYFGESIFTGKNKRRECTAYAREDAVELVVLSLETYQRLINN